MRFKEILIVLVLVSMYLAVYFSKVTTGLLFYYVQILCYSSIVALTWSSARNYFRHSPFTPVMSFLVLSYLSVYMALGFWTGFGLTPYSTTPVGVAVNIVYTVFRVLALEFLRVSLADALRYRCRSLAILLPALVVWLLAWFPSPLLSFTLSMDGLKLAFRYLIPSFIGNVFSTFVVLDHGVVPSLIYNLVPQLFVKMSPILPMLNWFVEGTVSALLPLVGYYLAIPYSRVFRLKGPGRLRVEARNATRLIAYFSLVALLIFVSQGYLGFRLYALSSGSMEPSLRLGDLVVICNSCKEIDVGDIVAYASKWGVIVHRVLEVDWVRGYLVTKGDSNRDPDPEPIPLENVLGKVVFSIPMIGYLPLFVREILTGNLHLAAFTLVPFLSIVLLAFGRAKYKGRGQ